MGLSKNLERNIMSERESDKNGKSKRCLRDVSTCACTEYRVDAIKSGLLGGMIFRRALGDS